MVESRRRLQSAPIAETAFPPIAFAPPLEQIAEGIEEEMNGEEPNGISYDKLFGVYGMTAAASATTLFWDVMLTSFGRKFVKYERHDTITQEHESLFSKLS